MSISLNIYDGKTMQEVVRELLDVVQTQGNTIAEFQGLISSLRSEIVTSERRSAEKMKLLSSSVLNISQNLQGFVDKEAQDMHSSFGVEAPSYGSSEVFVNTASVNTVQIKAAALPSAPTSRSVTPMPTAVSTSPRTSPEQDERNESEQGEEPTAEPLAGAVAEPAAGPAAGPAIEPAEEPAAEPAEEPEAAVPAVSPDTVEVAPRAPSPPLKLPVLSVPQGAVSPIRRRFQKAVKKLIVQNRMKVCLVGVLTSRAAKGMSVGERLKSAEDLIFATTKRCEQLLAITEKQAAELNVLREENGGLNESIKRLGIVDGELDEAIMKVDDRIAAVEPVVKQIAEASANAAADAEKAMDDLKEAITKVDMKADLVQGDFDTAKEKEERIVNMNSEIYAELMEECMARARKLSEEIVSANESESLTSDQIFHLRRQLANIDSVSNNGLNYGSLLSSYVEVDPTAYKGVAKSRRVISDCGNSVMDTIEPLWGTVASFDSNLAQSINLVMTLQTGLSDQAASLKQMEEELLTKAGVDAVAAIDSEQLKLRAASEAIESNVATFNGRVSSLNEQSAELSNKVVDIYDKMENIVDEEALKENVKKLLELYIKQLEAKQNGNTELVMKIQKELEQQSGEVDKLFKTKADVGEVEGKAEQGAVDEFGGNLSKLEQFMKQFEGEIEDMKSGQSNGMERLRAALEKKLANALKQQNSGGGGGGRADDEIALSHKKIDLCLACNRPMGKSVSMNASVPHFGPKFDPTGQLLGRQSARHAAMPGMLLQLEKDEFKRRATARNTMLLPKGLPSGLYSGGFQMPVKKGMWSQDLGGGDIGGGNRVRIVTGSGDDDEDNTRERQVRKTLVQMKINPDSVVARETMLNKVRTKSNAADMAGPKVGKSWMSVSSKGLAVDPESNGREKDTSPSVDRQRSKSMHGKSLNVVKSPKHASIKRLDQGGGGEFSLPMVQTTKIT
jgi:hypothetical protein